MKRDMCLIRRIVLDVADATDTLDLSTWEDSGKMNYDHVTIGYHIRLLNDAGYLNASFDAADNDPYYSVLVENLTWKGQDLADSLRPDSVWNQVNSRLKEFGAAVTIDIVQALATSIICQMLNLPK